MSTGIPAHTQFWNTHTHSSEMIGCLCRRRRKRHAGIKKQEVVPACSLHSVFWKTEECKQGEVIQNYETQIEIWVRNVSETLSASALCGLSHSVVFTKSKFSCSCIPAYAPCAPILPSHSGARSPVCRPELYAWTLWSLAWSFLKKNKKQNYNYGIYGVCLCKLFLI